MSRVEQALRRNRNERRDHEDRAPHPSQDAHLPPAAEEYPLERPYAADAGPRPAPVPAREAVVLEPELRRPMGPRVAPSVDRVSGGKLVVSDEASPAIVEQYGRLAAAVYHAQAEHGIRSIMVSSALPREGKTLTTVNLALTLSRSYRQRVLVIDTDLRGASVHTLFGVPLSPGLGEFLDVQAPDAPIVAVSDTLSVLSAGTSANNPIAGLVSDRMKRLLEHASARFDWVLLDTPPIALLSDANLLARVTDGVVFVIAAAFSPCAAVQRAIATIGPERVLGVVLNRAADSSLPPNTYYSRYGTAGRGGVDR